MEAVETAKSAKSQDLLIHIRKTTKSKDAIQMIDNLLK